MSEQTGIVLFVHNRHHHTEQVLEGLKKNKVSKLYIFSDGPKGTEDIKKVKEVRSLIANIDMCHNCKINVVMANPDQKKKNTLFSDEILKVDRSGFLHQEK